MSRFRLTCFLGAVLPLLLVAGCFAVSTFPLRAAAQEEPASSKERIYKVGKDGVSTPSLVHRVEPTYTKEARDAGLEGTVVLSVVVGPDDRTHDMEVLSRVGMGLDQQAVDAVKQWRFEPARKDGEPVAIQATIEVNFRLMDDLEEEDANGKPQPQETKK